MENLSYTILKITFSHWEWNEFDSIGLVWVWMQTLKFDVSIKMQRFNKFYYQRSIQSARKMVRNNNNSMQLSEWISANVKWNRKKKKNGVKKRKKKLYGAKFYNPVDGIRGHVLTRRLFAFYLQRVCNYRRTKKKRSCCTSVAVSQSHESDFVFVHYFCFCCFHLDLFGFYLSLNPFCQTKLHRHND